MLTVRDDNGKIKRIKYLYIMTTRDEFELPLAVADSTKELSQMTGVAVNTIRQLMSPCNQKDRPHSGFYKVPV